MGSPVAHSKSPQMHAAAYRALGLEHTYEAIDVDELAFAAVVEALKQGSFDGLNVTVPHKLRALALADAAAESAMAVGAANTLVRSAAGHVVAHNTDVEALRRELVALAGSEDAIAGKTGVVIGTGGAARAAVQALGELGAARIVVLGRKLNALTGERVVAGALSEGAFAADDVAAIVQATTAGMEGGPDGAVARDAIDWAGVPKGAVALDVVYGRAEAPFVAAARAAGLRATDGRGMLARQGALAFELWLGIPAPLAEMRAALEA